MKTEQQLFAKFQSEIQSVIKSLDDNAKHNRQKCKDVRFLAEASTYDGLFSKLNEIDFHQGVRLLAKHKPFQELILNNVDRFVQHYPKDVIKALVYQACQDNNLALVKKLVEAAKIDICKETVASPFDAPTVKGMGDSTHVSYWYYYPLLRVAARYKATDVFNYALEFYNLDELDKKAELGILQSCLAEAVEHRAFEIVNILLDMGVTTDCKKDKKEHRTVFDDIVVCADKDVLDKAYTSETKLSQWNKECVIRRAPVATLAYFIAKGESFPDNEGYKSNEFFKLALQRGSVEIMCLLLSHQDRKQFPDDIYPAHEKGKEYWDEKRIKYWDHQFAYEILDEGSTKEFIEYVEQELKFPVVKLLKNEISNNANYSGFSYKEHLAIPVITSYNIDFIEYMFETRGAKPSNQQMAQLVGLAYNCGRCVEQYRKFVTHAYVYSHIHPNPEMSQLLRAVSKSKDLANFTDGQVFALFADYTKSNRQRPEMRRHGDYFKENSILIMGEIARRKLTVEQLLELAKADNGKYANDILFFLVVSGDGYTSEQVANMLAQPCFDLNADLGKGDRALHIVTWYQRSAVRNTLLKNGADPDIANKAKYTAINYIRPGCECSGQVKPDTFTKHISRTQLESYH